MKTMAFCNLFSISFRKQIEVLSVIALLLCNYNQRIFAQSSNTSITEDTTVVELFAIPSPDEIIDYVAQKNLKYQKDILFNTNNLDGRFLTAKDKYIALGMALTDLAYTVSFNKFDASYKYLQAVDDLGKQLNVIPPQIEQIKDRFFNNMNQPDTIKAIYFEVYELVMMNFYENNRFNHYTLISSGIFIESLYLSVNSVDRQTQDKEFQKRIWEQKMVYDQLMSMIGKNLDAASKTLLRNEMTPLGNCFAKYAGDNPVANKPEKQNNDLIVIGNKESKIDLNAAIPEVRSQIEILRAKWCK
jgi:hypothetical protein